MPENNNENNNHFNEKQDDKKNISFVRHSLTYGLNKIENLLYYISIMLKQKVEKHWKNTKFIILFYTHDNDCEDFDNKLKQELVNQGFMVLDTQDLTGKLMNAEYSISKVSHPNKKTWDLIVPKLSEKLN